MFITHGAAQFFALDFGDRAAPPLVAIGGWTGSWELWAQPFSHLCRSWRAIAYDHRGAGATICPPESITLERMTADVFVIFDALGIDRAVLAAESSGAAVAIRAALEKPERVTGLVLVDGLYHRPMPATPTQFRLGIQHRYEATVAAFVEACVPEPDSEAIKHWGRQILLRSPQAAAIRLYDCMDGVDLRPQIAHITQPTLVIHGENDRIVPFADAEWLAAHLPDAELFPLADTGHVPTMTRPREVAEAIHRFFADRL